ncbi:MAG: hypothetical protein KC912_14120 [Proteobacteria bacterium]|nr:hypothetical protein [Pseudomonadota bacterium]
MSEIAALEPHGQLQPLFDDVWRVVGSAKMGPLMRLSRNMVVLRHEGSLALVNAIRLDEAGLKALEALGTIDHVVKIGVHSMDDAFYAERYDVKRWRLSGVEGGTDVLSEHTLPHPGLSLFRFEHTVNPESALMVDALDLLITCDSVQHWETMPIASLPMRLATKLMGFENPAQIGPPWLKMMTPPGGSLEPDFQRMLTLGFKHLIGGHGGLARDNAPELLRTTMTRMF